MKGTLSEDGSILVVHIPMRLKRWGAKTEIIAPPGAPDWAPPPPSPQQAMLKALGRAHRWLKMLESGKVASMKELAEQEEIDSSHVPDPAPDAAGTGHHRCHPGRTATGVAHPGRSHGAVADVVGGTKGKTGICKTGMSTA